MFRQSWSGLQEFEHSGIPFVGVADVAPVRPVLDDMEQAVWDCFVGAGTGTFERYYGIRTTVNDQGRYGDLR